VRLKFGQFARLAADVARNAVEWFRKSNTWHNWFVQRKNSDIWSSSRPSERTVHVGSMDSTNKMDIFSKERWTVNVKSTST
jgi:hypothetical protein